MLSLGELIPILPRAGLCLRLIGPNTAPSPHHPKIQQLARLYAHTFENWGGLPMNIPRTLDYLTGYTRDRAGIIAILEFQQQVIGAMLVSYGPREAVVRDIVHNIGETYHLLSPGIDTRLARYHAALMAAAEPQCLHVSDLLFAKKSDLKAAISAGLDDLLFDLQADELATRPYGLSPAARHATFALFGLVQSFHRVKNLRHPNPKLVHDLYRLFTLCLFLGTLTCTHHLSGFNSHQTTCLQWTCVGSEVYRLFYMVCRNTTARRLAHFFDSSLPLIGRVAKRLPGNELLINALINLGKNSSVIWEGPITGDALLNAPLPRTASRRKLKAIQFDPYAISLSRFPLDGLIAVVYNWSVYNFIVRRRLTLIRRRPHPRSRSYRRLAKVFRR
jgi:hypothetical protein